MPSRFGEMGPPKREGIRIRAVGAMLPYPLSLWRHGAAEPGGHTDARCFRMPSRFGNMRAPNREGIRMGTVCQIERACRAYPLEGSEVAWSLAEGSAALSHSPHPSGCTAQRCVALACAVD